MVSLIFREKMFGNRRRAVTLTRCPLWKSTPQAGVLFVPWCELADVRKSFRSTQSKPMKANISLRVGTLADPFDEIKPYSKTPAMRAILQARRRKFWAQRLRRNWRFDFARFSRRSA